MTTNRARAGKPHPNQPMDCSSAGCNYPESECIGLCMHRVHPSQVEQVEVVEPVKVHKPEPGLIAGFLGIFKKEWK